MYVSILYESFFGNTEKIAQAMAEPFGSAVLLKKIDNVSFDELTEVELLVVGSPTRGFRPCEKTKAFLKSIPENGLNGVKVAAFDTRIMLETIKSKPLRFMVKTGGYAAKHIAKTLQKKGGKLVAPPEGFMVTGEEGPLADEELERARNWAVQIIQQG
jgi:flavodoxin